MLVQVPVGDFACELLGVGVNLRCRHCGAEIRIAGPCVEAAMHHLPSCRILADLRYLETQGILFLLSLPAWPHLHVRHDVLAS